MHLFCCSFSPKIRSLPNTVNTYVPVHELTRSITHLYDIVICVSVWMTAKSSLTHFLYTHQHTFGFVAKSLYGKLTRIIECVFRENFLTEPVSALRRTLDPSLNVNLSLICQDVCRESSEGETATQKRDKNEGKQNKILHFLSVKAKGRCSFIRAFWNSLFIFSLMFLCGKQTLPPLSTVTVSRWPVLNFEA